MIKDSDLELPQKFIFSKYAGKGIFVGNKEFFLADIDYGKIIHNSFTFSLHIPYFWGSCCLEKSKNPSPSGFWVNYAFSYNYQHVPLYF